MILGVPAAAVKLPAHEVHLAYAGLVWMPFIVVTASLAWTLMDSLAQAKTDTVPASRALSTPQTWIMSLLYIGTFGSFIGYSFALPLRDQEHVPVVPRSHHSFIATYLAGLGFMGALLGSLARPLGGWLADRVGGAASPCGASPAMALATAVAIDGVQQHSFTVFFAAFMVDLPVLRRGQRLDVPDDPVDLHQPRRAREVERRSSSSAGRRPRSGSPGRSERSAAS